MWQIAEVDVYTHSLPFPKSAVHELEIPGSGLLDQSNSIVVYKGIMVFKDIGTPMIGERLSCTEREIKKSLKGPASGRSDSKCHQSSNCKDHTHKFVS